MPLDTGLFIEGGICHIPKALGYSRDPSEVPCMGSPPNAGNIGRLEAPKNVRDPGPVVKTT